MLRMFAASAAVIALSALWLATAPPASALSLRYLQPKERAAMLTTCGRLHRGKDRDLCRRVVDDPGVIANVKRGCLWAMTALLQGSTWAKVQSLPATYACTTGLRRAGYPVNVILRRLD